MGTDPAVLDDLDVLETRDTSGMLAAVASAGDQVRGGAAAAAAAGLDALAAEGLPRTVVVAGMGGSGMAGAVLSSLTGAVPVVLHRGYGLPEWVGPADLIVAVSASGSTEETLSAVEEAARRGARLVTVGAPDSPLSARCGAGRRRHVPVDSAGQQPRARLWSLAVPVLAAADAAGVISVSAEVLSAVADRLDRLADRCRPAVDRAANPAKALAGHLAGGLPLVWGSTRLAGVAATRFGCQLNENAQVPAVTGELPEATHNQIVVLDGPYRRDLRMVLLRDAGEPPELARRRAVCRELAESRGVEVADVPAEGRHPLERLASLIAVTDYASVYLALLLGVDPTPIWPITYLKERIAGD